MRSSFAMRVNISGLLCGISLCMGTACDGGAQPVSIPERPTRPIQMPVPAVEAPSVAWMTVLDARDVPVRASLAVSESGETGVLTVDSRTDPRPDALGTYWARFHTLSGQGAVRSVLEPSGLAGGGATGLESSYRVHAMKRRFAVTKSGTKWSQESTDFECAVEAAPARSMLYVMEDGACMFASSAGSGHSVVAASDEALFKADTSYFCPPCSLRFQNLDLASGVVAERFFYYPDSANDSAELAELPGAELEWTDGERVRAHDWKGTYGEMTATFQPLWRKTLTFATDEIATDSSGKFFALGECGDGAETSRCIYALGQGGDATLRQRIDVEPEGRWRLFGAGAVHEVRSEDGEGVDLLFVPLDGSARRTLELRSPDLWIADVAWHEEFGVRVALIGGGTLEVDGEARALDADRRAVILALP